MGTLEKHVRRPHDYYLQCRSGIAHCIWNLYCTQFPEKPIEEFDESSRELAKEIYKKSNLVEEVPAEYEYTGPSTDLQENSGELTEEEKEKAALLEATKKMLDESSQRVAEARDGTEALKKESEDAKQALAALQSTSQETGAQDTVGAQTPEEPQRPVVKSAAEIALEKEREDEKAAKEKEKEQEERLSRKKQWEAEDNERKQRENERRKKRERALEENIKQEREKEKKMREVKKQEEEEK